MAVPKSITIAGDKLRHFIANELTKRSAPASSGLSMFTFKPNPKISLSITNGLILKYFLINILMLKRVSLTTDAIQIPVISSILTSDNVNICESHG